MKRRHEPPASGVRSASSLAIGVTAAFVTAVALVFGGGTGRELWGDLAVELASLVLIVLLVMSRDSLVRHTGAWSLVLLVCILALPLLQLVPLPASIWPMLPGRADVAAAFGAIDVPIPVEPISLTPGNTLNAVFCLLPPAALFLATATGREPFDRLVGFTILAVLAASLLLGLAQIVQGPASELRFFAETNRENAVGFFANRNHNAAFAYAAALLCAPLVVSRTPRRRAPLAGVLALLFLMFASVFLTGSRAGLALATLAALVLLVATLNRKEGRQSSRFLLPGLIAAFVVVALATGALDVLGRFSARDITADARWTIARTALEGLRTFFPVGSGFGAFETTYLAFERLETLQAGLVNHAHDDWLELVYEGGVPALGLLLAFLVWLGSRTVNHLRSGGSGGPLPLCALAAVVLVLLHSTVDYPLRTVAVASVFARSPSSSFGATRSPPPRSPGCRSTCRDWRRERRRSPPRSIVWRAAWRSPGR